ncbi:MAG: iron-responsive transcriptional regulator RirA [Calditrichia bacterium]
MNLSKTSEYAIRLLLYLSLHPDRKVTTRELNSQLKLSFKYIGRLLSKLVAAGIIFSERGKNGGYTLARSPEQIKLIEIIMVVDDWDKYTQCMMGFGHCNENNPCAMHDVWAPVRNKLIELFEATTVHDLIAHVHEKV